MAEARLSDETRALTEHLVALRRKLHAWPELGFEETRTAQLAADELAACGFSVRTQVGKTGVVGTLTGTAPGRTVLLRADMDALPLTEEGGRPYGSTRPGVMHACGHDGHTAILMTVARRLAGMRERLRGTVKLAFQPAEELPPGGALAMVEAGLLSEAPAPEAVFGLHLWNQLPVGTIGVARGPMLASSDRFDITVRGVGCHGAQPHLGVDPIVVASTLVGALQTIVSREVPPLSPAVVTVGELHAGTAFNVIPTEARISGTVRAVDVQLRKKLAERIEAIATGLCAAMRAECSVRFSPGYPVTVNDDAMGALARAVAANVVGSDNVVEPPLTMSSDDMGYLLERVPGCYLWVGSRNPGKGFVHPHHNAKFDFDEGALPIGVELLTGLATAFLEAGA